LVAKAGGRGEKDEVSMIDLSTLSIVNRETRGRVEEE
jgi:hypothetical protein